MPPACEHHELFNIKMPGRVRSSRSLAGSASNATEASVASGTNFYFKLLGKALLYLGGTKECLLEGNESNML
ncbi:hypothetical protein Tcan_12207 [Toxocara canis]|uniref:Uncharacterized protein n=1 Tax=Toxocara canis TaxID=6265 RepID=A0A0B2W176_TOXCA|nr:hypothetical protein Tcan_12207 [Toxocara canis]